MAVATFDTLKFANTLKAAGVPSAQAVAFAEVIWINRKEWGAKDDLKREIDDAKKEAKQDLKEVEQRLTAKIDTLAAQLKGDIYLLKWMTGTVLAVGIGVGSLVVRLMFMLGR